MPRPGNLWLGWRLDLIRSRRAWRGLLVGLAVALAASTGLAAEAEPAIEAGVQALEARQFEQALEYFEAARLAEPENAEAAFFTGVALNRLGRAGEALVQLERARASGYPHPDLPFELGWSLLRLELYHDAITQLEAYEKAQPGRGQTQEFLGRAYLAQGRLDEAEAALKKALRRDRDLAPTVHLALADLEHRRGDALAAARQYQRLTETAGGTAAGSLAERYLARGAEVGPAPLPVPEDKRWRLSLSAAVGYNSNVVAIGDGIALPGDITDKDSAVGRFTLHGAYDLLRQDENNLTVGYALQANLYENALEQADLHDHYLYGHFVRYLQDDLAATMRLSYEYTNVGDNTLRHQLVARPGLNYRVNPHLTAELAYSFAASEYSFPTTAFSDRDSLAHTILLAGYFRVPDSQLTGRAGYYHTFTNADGADFDGDTDALFVSLAHPLPLEIQAEVSYSHLFQEYDNPNSFTGFATTRDDDIDVVAVEVSRAIPLPIAERARAFARYEFINNDSNIAFFEYDQHLVLFGMTAEW